MTPPTKIKELEEDFKAINECGPAWPALDGLLKAMKVYLGEHETLVIVPRDPTKEMITSGGIYGRFAYSDIYKAMIQASQRG